MRKGIGMAGVEMRKKMDSDLEMGLSICGGVRIVQFLR